MALAVPLLPCSTLLALAPALAEPLPVTLAEDSVSAVTPEGPELDVAEELEEAEELWRRLRSEGPACSKPQMNAMRWSVTEQVARCESGSEHQAMQEVQIKWQDLRWCRQQCMLGSGATS